jgi:ethanolamine utilization protein EutP (predicted NTPase)
MRDGGPEYETFASGLREQLAALHEERLVRVAFVGQYSAGKSTLIAALTGRDDIRIDADIATDRATDYDWNGILLTDTPGLYTERTDHDAITYQTLAAADLLIFTITSSLFDRLILDNFITLAYQQSYRQKMLLVVNKMNMEDRSFDELVTNYRASLARALRGEGYSLDDFRLVFVDAADYREGRQLNEPDLIMLSNFGAFLDALNDFVAERGVLGRLDTPIRTARRQVEQALLSQQADEQNRRFFHLLDRLEQRILRAQHDTQIELRRITGDLWSRITGRSGELVVRIGDPEVDLTNESREVERFIIEAVDVAQRDLEQRLTQRTEELRAEMREVLDSDLGQHYLGLIAASGLELERPRQTDNTTLRRNVETLNAVLQKASQDYIGLAGVAGTAGRVGSLQVAGSQAHTQIYAIGKFFGYKFRPWEAVKLTKNIANVAKFVGPALTLVGTVIDAYDLYAQQAHERKLMAAQNTCATEFMELATDIERQFQQAFAAYSAEVYAPALDLIATRRAEAIRDQTQRSALFQRLDNCRIRLDTLLQAVYQEK